MIEDHIYVDNSLTVKNKGNKMKSHIGDKLRYIRESKGLSLSDVSEHLGMKTKNAVLMIELGQKSPELNRLEAILDLFGMSVVQLYEFELPENYIRNAKSSILGQKIAKAREELGQSLQALAEATNIEEKYLKRIESGTLKKVSLKDQLALSRSLGLKLEYLADNDIPVT